MSIDDLIGGPRRFERPMTARAKVKVAPADHSSTVVLTMVDLGGVPWEIPPANWVGRGAGLPEVGDSALIVFDHRGDAWAQIGTVYADGGSGGAEPVGEPLFIGPDEPSYDGGPFLWLKETAPDTYELWIGPDA